MKTSVGGSRFSKGDASGRGVGPGLGRPPVLHGGGSPRSRQPPSRDPRGRSGTAIQVSQRGPAAPENTLTRVRCTRRVSALALERTHHGHASRCPFLQPVRLAAQRNVPASGQRCSPTAFAGRGLLPDLGQPSLRLCYLQVTYTVPAEAHLPLPLSAPSLSEANYARLPLQCWDAWRSVVANTVQGSGKGYFITYSFLDVATFSRFESAVLEDGSPGHLMRNLTVSKTLPSRHCSPFPPSHASRPCERKRGCSRTRSAESSANCPHACRPPDIARPPSTTPPREEAFAPTERRRRLSTSPQEEKLCADLTNLLRYSDDAKRGGSIFLLPRRLLRFGTLLSEPSPKLREDLPTFPQSGRNQRSTKR